MQLEHGIEFNKPYTTNSELPRNVMLKSNVKLQGQMQYPNAYDLAEIAIPISVIGDDVFCITMVYRSSNSKSEYEMQPPMYVGGAPQALSFYYQETERLAYYHMIPLKEFIEKWKIKN